MTSRSSSGKREDGTPGSARKNKRTTYGSGRVTTGAYVRVAVPVDHPLRRKTGPYVYEHRLVAWEAGLLTDLTMHVHHKNGDKQDNRLENLEVLAKIEHHRHHASEGGANQFGPFVRVNGQCTVDDCENDARSRGLCTAHYCRFINHGTTDLVDRKAKALRGVDPDDIERLFLAGVHRLQIAEQLGAGPNTVRRVLRERGHKMPVGRPPKT